MSAPLVEKSAVVLPIVNQMNLPPKPLVWSHESQQERYPGDIGFAQLKAAVTVKGTWPN